MENNKYYVPEISEFHVGFEYEHLTGFEKQFKSYIYDLAKACLVIERESISHNGEIVKMFIPAIQACIEEKQCRVKYLDQEGIESLGWKDCDNIYNTIRWNFNDYILMFYKKDNRYLIFRDCGPNNIQTVFNGFIKNKSELIKLMQQLNIK